MSENYYEKDDCVEYGSKPDTNAISLSNSSCLIREKLKAVLIRDASGNYYFKLCCPQIVTIQNKCSNRVVVTIPKCFLIDDLFFEVVDPQMVTYEYHNMTNGQSTPSVAVEINGNALLEINTDSVFDENKICIDDLCIPVSPKCLSKQQFCGCVGSLECTISFDF
jgi:hypothetical protein